jgi:hypothetical protein
VFSDRVRPFSSLLAAPPLRHGGPGGRAASSRQDGWSSAGMGPPLRRPLPPPAILCSTSRCSTARLLPRARASSPARERDVRPPARPTSLPSAGAREGAECAGPALRMKEPLHSFEYVASSWRRPLRGRELEKSPPGTFPVARCGWSKAIPVLCSFTPILYTWMVCQLLARHFHI